MPSRSAWRSCDADRDCRPGHTDHAAPRRRGAARRRAGRGGRANRRAAPGHARARHAAAARAAGAAAHAEPSARAPMTARGSFVAGCKRLGIALGWLAAFLAIGVGVIVLLAWILPAAPDTWWLARGAAIQALGFGVATWIVG